VLDTRDVIEESIVTTVRGIEKLGMNQYNVYHKSVIIDKTMIQLKEMHCHCLAIQLLKQSWTHFNDVKLFSHSYIVMQHRDGDTAASFKHENHPYTQLLFLTEEDGAAIYSSSSATAGVSTFDDYARHVFLPYVKKQLDASAWIDVIWDTFVPSSIKESTWDKWGNEKGWGVAGKNKVPNNCVGFLHECENKKQLFSFLYCKLAAMECGEGKFLATTTTTTTGQLVASTSISHNMEVDFTSACTSDKLNTFSNP